MRLLSVILLLLATAAAAAPPSPPANVRMQQVVRAFVAETGQEVVGLGSWISGQNYRSPLTGGGSDHDMRLVVRGGDRAAALRQWQQARTRLQELVRREFGRDAERVLGSVNLYPPSQLMRGVENANDAVARFRELGEVPNLRATGVPRNAAQFAEGLYGDGSQVWTQGYERSSGRLFYRDNGKVFAGMTDLTHLTEGAARFDIGGMASTSRQWLEHLDDALRTGNTAAAAKYLERLNRDLAKAKNLGRLDMDMAFRNEMNTLARQLKNNPASLAASRARLEAVMARAQRETELLGHYARSGPLGRAVLGEAMADLAGQGRLRAMLSEAGNLLNFDQALRALTLYVELRRSTAYAAEEEFDRAYESALAGALGMASLPAGLAAELGAFALDAAKQQGYDFVASTQDAWDLMAGVYTAVGRHEADAGRAYELADLVRTFDDEGALEQMVRAKAALAANRELGEENARTDARVADAVFARCWPVIRDAWLLEREKLTVEYEQLCDEMRRMPVLMAYTPAELTPPATVQVSARAQDRDFDRKRERLKEIVSLLCHTDPYVNVYWKWQGGEEGREPWQRTYTFAEAGRHASLLTLEVRVGATGKWANSPFSRSIECRSGVDVTVAAPPAADTPAVVPPPVRDTAPVPAAGRVTPLAGDWEWQCVDMSFYDGGRLVGGNGPNHARQLYEAVVERMEGGAQVKWRMDKLRFYAATRENGRLIGEASTGVNFIPSMSVPEKAWTVRMSVDGRPQGSLRVTMTDNRGGPPVTFGPYSAGASDGLREHTGRLVFPPAYAVTGDDARVQVRIESRGERGGLDLVMTFALRPKE